MNQSLSSRSTTRYLDDTSSSRTLWDRALTVMPGGNSRHTVVMDPYPVYVHKGRGCRVWDVEGDERIDFINNYTSLIHGHSDPQVTAAVTEVIANGTAFSLPTERDIQLAELLIERIPYAQQLRFANSGSEGVLLALRAARGATERSKIAKFEGCYHGIYDYAQASDSSRPHNWGDPQRPTTTLEPSMAASLATDVVTLPWNDIDVCRALIEENASDLAAVLFDPLPAALGLLEPRADFVQFLREITQRHGILLVADEVLSFRVDFAGACNVYGIEPDLLALGKIIGGGFPVGAVAGSQEVMAVFDHREGEKVHHGGTYNGNPVTMVAGYETMVQLTPDRFDHLEKLAEQLREGMTRALSDRGVKHRINGRGSLMMVLLTDQELSDFRSVARARAHSPQLAEIAREMLHHGILLGQRGLFLSLSTPMQSAEIEAFLEAFERSLDTLGIGAS